MRVVLVLAMAVVPAARGVAASGLATGTVRNAVPPASGGCGCGRPLGGSVTLDAAQMTGLLHGKSVAGVPGLGRLLGRFQGCKGERIEVRYPADRGGNLWAQKLQSMLVARGVPAGRIESSPDLHRSDDFVTMVVLIPGEQLP